MLKQLMIAIGLSAMVLATVSYAASATGHMVTASKPEAGAKGADELHLIGSEQSAGGRSKRAL
jgi:hypothetical protein